MTEQAVSQPAVLAVADDREAVLAEFGVLAATVEEQAVAVPASGVLRDGNGRFLPGTAGGPGRKPGRGLDLRALAEREAAREGFDLNAGAWRVLRKLFSMAEAGDVAAAKLVLDKLGIVEGAAAHAGISLTVITGVDRSGNQLQGIAVRTGTATPTNPDAQGELE